MVAVTVTMILISCSLHLGRRKQLPKSLIKSNWFPPSGKILLMLLTCCGVSISIRISVIALLLLLPLVWRPVHLSKVRSIFRFE